MSDEGKILCPALRTEGDGMENSVLDKVEDTSNKERERLLEKLIYRPNYQVHTIDPPKTNLHLIPQNVISCKKKFKNLSGFKSKEPKFIPYEPYKAAVNPMIPKERKPKKELNLNEIVLPVEPKETTELLNQKKDDQLTKSISEMSINKTALEDEVKKLRNENEQLENQLKFQAQVNGELRNLLVAAVGEDIETRVNLLTEDKLQLAKALLNSAQNLSTHQEQIEWLAGQCEVWRSKFLASSLMIEEMAKWKATLCTKSAEFQNTVKQILEERNKVRHSLLNTYKTLNTLYNNFDPRHLNLKKELKSTNIIELSSQNNKFAQTLKLLLLGGNGEDTIPSDFNDLEMNTTAEKIAEHLLANNNLTLLSGKAEAACNAVMGAAVALGGVGISPMSCCAHCSGEIKQV